jgi:hypothetical protein
MTAARVDIPPLPKCECGNEIPLNVTLCVVCSASVGFPNVRYAARKEERDALEQRLADARISAKARGTADKLTAFGQSVARSKTVISRSQGDLDNLLRGDGELMQAFHPAVRAGLRVPKNNAYDPQRDENDSRVSPIFYDRLHFGALSIDGKGVPHYGGCAITLREDMTAKRTTVFEENPVTFVRADPKRRERIPYGYRAVWDDRHKLAMAKLEPKIEEGTQDEEFAQILMEPDGTAGDA